MTASFQFLHTCNKRIFSYFIRRYINPAVDTMSLESLRIAPSIKSSFDKPLTYFNAVHTLATYFTEKNLISLNRLISRSFSSKITYEFLVSSMSTERRPLAAG
jgi:hypothetical protein